MKQQWTHPGVAAAALCTALITLLPLPGALGHAAAATYHLVESWAQFPPGVRWSRPTGVDIDSHGTIYVLQQRTAMPILAFDGHGQFLRSWGEGMFTVPHLLRADAHGHIWATDRRSHQIFKFSAEGKLLMTLGRKDVRGDNDARDAFNGPADVVIAQDGSIFIADGESGNTRVVKYSPEGTFVKYWGGRGTEPGKFTEPHSLAMDSTGRIYVADRGSHRIQIFDQDGKYLDQWSNFDSPWSLFITGDDLLYVVDGSSSLRITNTRDGGIVDRIDGLTNPHGVAVDKQGAIYIAEIDGNIVKKFVKK
jgi:DNA-binding beta-propeller fold protein YncE